MGRKYTGIALCAAIWLVVLTVPALRLMFRVQVQGHDLFSSAVNTPSLHWSGWFTRAPHLYRQLAARYPNDARVQAKVLEWDSGGQEVMRQPNLASHRKKFTHHYDRFLERFPNEAWLVANRLRFTTHWLNDDRVAGDFEKVDGAPPPKKEKNFTPAELAQATAIAQKGRQLEPDNSYYDWMLAWFLFADDRDEEALAVLHEGAKKPRYDDHTLHDLQASIAVCELVRPLLVEEKIAVSAALLLPHLAKHRHVARLAVWEGVKAERAGDHQRALQIYADVARLGARMRASSHYLIQALVGTAIEAVAWIGMERKLTKAEEKRLRGQRNYPSEKTRITAKRFAAYAAGHGRADLAAEARREGEAVARFREQIHFPVNFIPGFPDEKFMTVLALWWAGAALLPQLLLTASVWLALSVILWRRQVFVGSVRWLDIASSVLVGGCACVLLMVAALRLGAGWGELFPSSDYPKEAIAALGSLIAVTPALLGAAYCACATMWRHRRALRTAQWLSKKDAPAAPWWERDLSPLLNLIGTWALHFLTVSSWVNLVIAPASDEPQNYTLPLVLSFLCVLRWVIKWLWFTPLPLRPITGYGLRWYRQTLGAFLLLSSVAYLLLSLVALPLRREADAKKNAYIQRGELAVMLEQNNKAR